MRILLVKTSPLGGVVHALPAASDLARQRPGVYIDWAVDAVCAGIPQQHVDVASVHVLPPAWSCLSVGGRAAIRRVLARHRYDLIVDLQGSLQSALLARLAQGPRVGVRGEGVRAAVCRRLYDHTVAVPAHVTVVDRCRHLVAAAVGYRVPDSRPDFGLAAPLGAWRPGPRPFAPLVPGVSPGVSVWSLSDWLAVAQLLVSRGLDVVVLRDGERGAPLASEIARACRGKVAPTLNASQLVGTLAASTVVVGGDQGITQLAAACGCPTVGGQGQMPGRQAVMDVLNSWL